MGKIRIILGSGSPRRAEVLRAALPTRTIEVMVPDIDEKLIRHRNPSALTMAIARAKNEAICGRIHDDAVVVTADTVSVCRGVVREKPRDASELREFILSYRVFPVTAVTAIWVHRTKTDWSTAVVDEATVTFDRFTDEEVDAIVAEPAFYDSAGGYLIEHPLMRRRVLRVRGDPQTVMGLPGRFARPFVLDALKD